MNIIYYQCNGYGHKSFDYRKKKPVPYNNFKDVPINENIKCYNYQGFGHIPKNFKNQKINQKKANLDQESVTKPELNIAADKKKETKTV